MVNGVLVERTVKDVLPTLKTNSDGLKQVLEDMLKQYKLKQTELDSWKVSTVYSQCFLWLDHGIVTTRLITRFLSYRRRTTFRSCSPELRLISV